MTCTRSGHSRYIGRVGALAVALGIGTAIAAPAGLAWASPTESDTSSATSDTSSAATDQSSNAESDSKSAESTSAESTSGERSGGERKRPIEEDDKQHSDQVEVGRQDRTRNTRAELDPVHGL